MSKKADKMFVDIFSIVGFLGAILSTIGITAKIFGLITFPWLIVLFPALLPLVALVLLMLVALPIYMLQKTYDATYGDEG